MIKNIKLRKIWGVVYYMCTISREIVKPCDTDTPKIYALHLVLRKMEIRRRSIHVPSVFGTLIFIYTVICIYNQFNPNV